MSWTLLALVSSRSLTTRFQPSGEPVGASRDLRVRLRGARLHHRGPRQPPTSSPSLSPGHPEPRRSSAVPRHDRRSILFCAIRPFGNTTSVRTSPACDPAPHSSLPPPPPPFSTCAGLRRPPELNHYQRNLSLFCDNVSAERLDRRRSRGHVRLSHDKRPEAKQQREARASGRGGRWQGMRRSILPQLLTPPSCTANIPSPG